MCDYFEDGDFMEEDEYDADMEIDEPFTSDTKLEDEPIETGSQDDDFTAKDAFFAGSFAGWAYEEGLNKRKRRKRKRFGDDSD